MSGGEVVNVSEAARVAGVSRQAVMGALRRGSLAGTGSVPPTVTRAELERWMAARAGNGGSGSRHRSGVSGPAQASGSGGQVSPVVGELAGAVAVQASTVAELVAENVRLAAENSRLHAEVARLRGQSGGVETVDLRSDR